MWACHFNIVQYLIQNGADLELKTNDRYTALSFAVKYKNKNKNITQLLLNNGANPLNLDLSFLNQNDNDNDNDIEDDIIDFLNS